MNWEDIRDTLLTDRGRHPITSSPANSTFHFTASRIPSAALQPGGTVNGVYRNNVPGPFHTDRESIGRSQNNTVERNLVFGENGNLHYGLASRGISANAHRIDFAGGNVAGFTATNVGLVFMWSDTSFSLESEHTIAVRPVITLNSNVRITGGEGTADSPFTISN